MNPGNYYKAFCRLNFEKFQKVKLNSEKFQKFAGSLSTTISPKTPLPVGWRHQINFMNLKRDQFNINHGPRIVPNALKTVAP